jgi:hypothetical protein
MRIFQRQDIGQRDQRAHSLHLFQPRHLGITLLAHALDLLVVFADPFAQRFDLSQQWFQRRAQFRTQLLSFLRVQVPRIAPRNRSP